MSEEHNESSRIVEVIALEHFSKRLRDALAGIDNYLETIPEADRDKAAEDVMLKVIKPAVVEVREEIGKYIQPWSSSVDAGREDPGGRGLVESAGSINFPGVKK